MHYYSTVYWILQEIFILNSFSFYFPIHDCLILLSLTFIALHFIVSIGYKPQFLKTSPRSSSTLKSFLIADPFYESSNQVNKSPRRMKYLTGIWWLDLVSLIVFLLVTLLCGGIYVLCLTLHPQLKEAMNFEVSGGFMITSFVFSLFASIFLIFTNYNWFVLDNKSRHRIIAELIYILGLDSEGKRMEPLGEEAPAETVVSQATDTKETKAMEDTISVSSEYGFGLDESGAWSYTGRIPPAALAHPLPRTESTMDTRDNRTDKEGAANNTV